VDYYALERAAYQASETRRLTSSAALQSRKEAIVGEATEKTRAALAATGHISKRARRSGIRENRAAEKQIERDNNKWLLGQTTSSEPTLANEASAAPSTANAEYVPASSKLSRIGELIEEEWNNK